MTAEAEARFIVEEVSGYDAAEWLDIADAVPPDAARGRLARDGRPAGRRGAAAVRARLRGRSAASTSWSIARVLIPRPETE